MTLRGVGAVLGIIAGLVIIGAADLFIVTRPWSLQETLLGIITVLLSGILIVNVFGDGK